MRRPVQCGLVAVLVCAMAACGSGVEEEAGPGYSGPAIGGTLNLYTPNDQGLLDALIPVFERETGISVNQVTAGAGELYVRIREEVGDPQGDVMFGGGLAQAVDNGSLWEPYTGAGDKRMTTLGRNVGGFATPYQADGSVLLVNTAQLGSVKIAGYADLLNRELKGKIVFGDPTNSATAIAHLTNMLTTMGDAKEPFGEAAWEFVASLLEQTGGRSVEPSTVAAQAVADGEYSVALVSEVVARDYVRFGAPLQIVYMSEGAVFQPSSVQIIKGAKNVAQAQAFCDWIQSGEAQLLIADAPGGRPLRKGVTAEGLTSLDTIKPITEDSAYVNMHRAELIARYLQVLASVG